MNFYDSKSRKNTFVSIPSGYFSEEDDNEKQKDEDPVNKDEVDDIVKTGSVITRNSRHKIHCITIIGEIEGHEFASSKSKTTKYENVIPQLILSEEDREIEGLLLVLNTVGGDVEVGLALAEIIAGMSKPTVSFVIGGGHSIGVPLAVSAKETFISRSATMTLHPVRSTGTVLGIQQTFEYFKKMQRRISRFVARNSNIDEERFLSLVMNTEELAMDVGTILEGEEAVNEGLIDKVGGIHDAFDALNKMIEHHF